MAIIAVNQVSKEYKMGKMAVPALRDINLEVAAQDFVTLCGPSGSGKTTLLNIIGCLDKPSQGNVKIVEREVTNLNDDQLSELRNEYIGFIFQTFNLIPVLSAYENVEYPLLILGKRKKERAELVTKMLHEVGLYEYKSHKPDELSGGQRQRVAIARALVTKPKLVLADEPTANLDSQTGIEILELMKQMNKELATTFIFSTHDPKVMKYARKVFYIEDGQITKGDSK